MEDLMIGISVSIILGIVLTGIFIMPWIYRICEMREEIRQEKRNK